MKPSENTLLLSAGLVAATLIFAYPLVLPTPLLEPDEGLHATISQEMVEHNEWIVPTFRGEPFLDKPILFFWAQMISLKAFGMTEFAVRLPGLLFGLLGTITAGLLAGRLFGSRTGWYAWLISMTMCIPLAVAQAAVHDVALVPWTNLALLCLWETERAASRRRQLGWLAGAACMFGLAFLTKALIGVAVIGVGYALFLIVSRQLSIGNCLRLAAAIVVGALIASPWFIAMEFRVTGYLHYYFIERHVMGFATATHRHGNSPWWYYAPYMMAGAIPWIWYAVPLIQDEWHRRSEPLRARPQLVFVLCWLFGGLLFLSLAKSKLVTYALPLFPAIAIVCAEAWNRHAARQLSEVSARWFLNLIRFMTALGVIVPLGILIVCQMIIGNTWPAFAWLAAFTLSAGSGITWWAIERKRLNGSVGLIAVWVGGVVCLVMTWPLQNFAENYSERSLARWVNEQETLPEHLILIGEKPGSVIFYLRKEVRQQLRRNQVTSMRIDELQPGTQPGSGEIFAVTNKVLYEHRLPDQHVPGSFTQQVGQFRLYRDQENALSLSQILWRSE
jgi:4-amino-4-deoxy-L-arabinose transferase-like glycosyltransferase